MMNLQIMKLAELQKMAKVLGIKGIWTMTKGELTVKVETAIASQQIEETGLIAPWMAETIEPEEDLSIYAEVEEIDFTDSLTPLMKKEFEPETEALYAEATSVASEGLENEEDELYYLKDLATAWGLTDKVTRRNLRNKGHIKASGVWSWNKKEFEALIKKA